MMNVGVLQLDAGPRAPLREGLRERILALRAIGLFSDVDDEAVTLLTEHARVVSFAPGATVLEVGHTPDHVYIVLEGNIRVTGAHGALFELGPGRPAGMIGILANLVPHTSATATVPTRALAIPRAAFLAGLEENFSFLRSALRLVTSTLMEARGDLPPVGAEDSQALPDDHRPRLLVDRALEIADAGLFREANIDAVFDVARILREVRVPAGYMFWRRGDAPGTSVRILSGVVRCTDGQGRSVVAGHDYLLGTISASAQTPHGYDAVAETAVRAYLIRFEDWLIVLEAHPELAIRLLAQLAGMLSETLDLGTAPARPG